MVYTIKKLARLSGVSVRTLHYYDEIGLLKPSFVGENGYRQYERPELMRLQHILFFRELAFPLAEIKTMIDAPDFDVAAALQEHKRLIENKRKQLGRLLHTIDKTITELTKGDPMKDEEIYDGLTGELKEYQKEAKERWGNTEAWRQSQARTKHWTKADYQRIAEDGKKFTQLLADTMDKGATSPEFQALIAKHHEGIEVFYDCPLTMYRYLGQMYVDDSRFAAYYNKFRPGLNVVVRDAIAHYCDVHANKGKE